MPYCIFCKEHLYVTYCESFQRHQQTCKKWYDKYNGKNVDDGKLHKVERRNAAKLATKESAPYPTHNNINNVYNTTINNTYYHTQNNEMNIHFTQSETDLKERLKSLAAKTNYAWLRNEANVDSLIGVIQEECENVGINGEDPLTLAKMHIITADVLAVVKDHFHQYNNDEKLFEIISEEEEGCREATATLARTLSTAKPVVTVTNID